MMVEIGVIMAKVAEFMRVKAIFTSHDWEWLSLYHLSITYRMG